MSLGVKWETHRDRPRDGQRRLHGDFLSLLFSLRKSSMVQDEVPSLRVGQPMKECFVSERDSQGAEPVIITESE